MGLENLLPSCAEQWGYQSTPKPWIEQAPDLLEDGDITLFYTSVKISSLDCQSQEIYWRMLGSPRGNKVMRAALKDRPEVGDLDAIRYWQGCIQGALFETLAITEIFGSPKGNSLFLAADELQMLYQKLYKGDPRKTHNFQGIQAGLLGMSLPDALVLKDDHIDGAPVWVVDTLYECKSGAFTKRVERQAQNLANPALVAKSLALDTVSGPGKVGWLVGQIKDVPPRKVHLDPAQLKIQYLVPQLGEGAFPLPGIKYQEVPTTKKDLVGVTQSLMADLIRA